MGAGHHRQPRRAAYVVVGLQLAGLEDHLEVGVARRPRAPRRSPRRPAGSRPARNAPRSMTMSISSAPASTASRVSASLMSIARGRWGRRWRRRRCSRRCRRASPSRRRPCRGRRRPRRPRGRSGRSGRGASPWRPAPGPCRGCPAPSSVVRSTIRMARSMAYALAVVLIERVPRPAARASAPTWSTPGSPCRKRRSEASERVTSERRCALSGPSRRASTLRQCCHHPSIGLARQHGRQSQRRALVEVETVPLIGEPVSAVIGLILGRFVDAVHAPPAGSTARARAVLRDRFLRRWCGRPWCARRCGWPATGSSCATC